MDMFEDEDIFELSDEDIHAQSLCSYNPLDDYLIKQLHEVKDCVARTKNEISHTELTSRNILKRLYKHSQFLYDDDSSDSDDDWYDEHGQPVVKKKKRSKKRDSMLTVMNVWQRVIDDKWVIGVELQNESDRVLEQPAFYLTIRGENELTGITSLWNVNNNSFWDRTTKLWPGNKKIAATAVLSIPNFHDTSVVVAYGTVVYVLEGHELQTPIGTIELSAAQALGKALTPRYAQDLNTSILAIKAAAIEKIITIPLLQEIGQGARLLDFFARIDFLEVMPDIHMSKNPETYRHCIFEILSLSDTHIILRISTKSTAQLNIILHMIGEEFPGAAETAEEDKTIGKVIALERELQLKLDCDEPAKLLNARIVTDLLIP